MIKRQESLRKAQDALKHCEKYQVLCGKCHYKTEKGDKCMAKNTIRALKEVEQQHKDAFKVIIAGCRDFSNQSMVNRTMDKVLQGQINKGKLIEIVSGKARGADYLGERYAAKRDWVVAEFPANWDKHGKSAGYKRNKNMAYYANGLVAFWDGKSRGTAHMIRIMLDMKKPVVVHSITKDITMYCHKEEDKKMVLKALARVN